MVSTLKGRVCSEILWNYRYGGEVMSNENQRLKVKMTNQREIKSQISKGKMTNKNAKIILIFCSFSLVILTLS
jgi:hypothetical protein